MRITTDYHEFFRTTKIISDWYRLRDIGLIVESLAGSILPTQIDEAIDICASDPTFHIVSHMGNGVLVNRYDKRGQLFTLAEGDNDPQYVLDTRHIYQWMFAGEFDKDEVLAPLLDTSK